MPFYWGKDKNIIQDISEFEVYTNDYLYKNDNQDNFILFKYQFKYGLLQKRTSGHQSGYLIVAQAIHKKIESISFKTTYDKKEHYLFLLYNDLNLISVLQFNNHRTKYMFSFVKKIKPYNDLLIFRNYDKTGFLRLDWTSYSGVSFKKIVWYTGKEKLDWETLEVCYGDIVIANKKGKYAVLDKRLIEMTPFCFEFPPKGTENGNYIITESNKWDVELNKNDFYKTYGSK